MGGHHDVSPEPPSTQMVATNEELEAARVPINYRDYCAHHFIKWQDCMRKNVLHWRCHEDELLWEKCQYQEHLRNLRKHELALQGAKH